MKKQVIKINESQLREIVKESIKQIILKESRHLTVYTDNMKISNEEFEDYLWELKDTGSIYEWSRVKNKNGVYYITPEFPIGHLEDEFEYLGCRVEEDDDYTAEEEAWILKNWENHFNPGII